MASLSLFAESTDLALGERPVCREPISGSRQNRALPRARSRLSAKLSTSYPKPRYPSLPHPIHALHARTSPTQRRRPSSYRHPLAPPPFLSPPSPSAAAPPLLHPQRRRPSSLQPQRRRPSQPPWDAYGAPSGRRICSGDATGRRISAAAGGGRLRCGHSLPASAQIRPAGESPTSLLCLWIGLEPPAAAGRTSASSGKFSDFAEVFDRNESLRLRVIRVTSFSCGSSV
ncbi:hypothetical protein HU200_030472 [Digitaria exilis]|uniref:Uncharacterized protein n=1 Tax=Digitaria exilis TaxID=1010633 RepID=A0A835BRU8_9POAL|nr:hypothetical protein HU200_030472 [Digitaria exilis]